MPPVSIADTEEPLIDLVPERESLSPACDLLRAALRVVQPSGIKLLFQTFVVAIKIFVFLIMRPAEFMLGLLFRARALVSIF